MTLITPDADDVLTEELMLEVQDTLREMRQAFRSLKERVEAGEDVKATEVKSKLTELNTVLVNCHKLETCLADSRAKRSQIVRGGYALDFDAARAEVLCALGRLRPCGGAEEVSG
ncbi:MAG: hypothetical protein AAFN94_02730 [Pseudomonadota bacterium]